MNKSINRIWGRIKKTLSGSSEYGKLKVGRGVLSAEIFLTAAVLLTSFLIFFYTDYSDTLDNGVLLAESVANGRFTDYYRYAAKNSHAMSQYSANYSIFLYGIFALWNLPTVIAHIVSGFDYMSSVAALLWCKALILAAVIAASFVLKKIVSLYSDLRGAQLAQILFLSGSCVVIPSMVTVQYDILSVLLMLCGIYYYLKDREGLFVLFFALAVPLKLFAVFVFIPLILLREKRIPFIVLKLIPAFAVNFICALPFSGDPWYELCLGTQNRDAVDLLLRDTVSIGDNKLNLFILIYIAVCVFCYIRKDSFSRGKDAVSEIGCSETAVKSQDKTHDVACACEPPADIALTYRYYLPLYACFAVFAAFMIFVPIRSYWVILVVPFEIFAVLFNRERLRANILLLTLGTGCYTVYSYISHWIYNTSYLVSKLALPMFVSLPSENRKYTSVNDMFSKLGISQFSDVLRTVFCASLIILLMINIPRRENVRRWSGEKYIHEWWHSLLQVCITCLLVAVLLYSNLASCSPAVIDISHADSYESADIISGNVLSQSFAATKDAEVSELVFSAESTDNYRSLRYAAVFTLTDETSGQILYEGLVGTSLVESKKPYSLDIGKVSIEKGHVYTLTVSADIAQHRSNLSFRLGVTDGLKLPDYPLTVDGAEQPFNLAFALK